MKGGGNHSEDNPLSRGPHGSRAITAAYIDASWMGVEILRGQEKVL